MVLRDLSVADEHYPVGIEQCSATFHCVTWRSDARWLTEELLISWDDGSMADKPSSEQLRPRIGEVTGETATDLMEHAALSLLPD
jgi:hypothetical protein